MISPLFTSTFSKIATVNAKISTIFNNPKNELFLLSITGAETIPVDTNFFNAKGTVSLESKTIIFEDFGEISLTFVFFKNSTIF